MADISSFGSMLLPLISIVSLLILKPYQKAINGLMNPRAPDARITTTIFKEKNCRATKTASPTTTPKMLKAAPSGHSTCIPNHTARFNTTPTTAAVMLDSAAESFLFPLNFSM